MGAVTKPARLTLLIMSLCLVLLLSSSYYFLCSFSILLTYYQHLLTSGAANTSSPLELPTPPHLWSCQHLLTSGATNTSSPLELPTPPHLWSLSDSRALCRVSPVGWRGLMVPFCLPRNMLETLYSHFFSEPSSSWPLPTSMEGVETGHQRRPAGSAHLSTRWSSSRKYETNTKVRN